MSLRTALHTLRRSATSAIRTTQNPIPVRAFAVVELGDSTAFENKVSNSSGVVVVDWSASWCGPCKMAAPVYEQLSEKYSQYPFYKIDVDTLGVSIFMHICSVCNVYINSVLSCCLLLHSCHSALA
eukprot:TRINITY_DN663_c0_g1_i1.p2 TRINITY_DN663_c0_g1~~TRINITY_DN663_c0_g1_i1.p2  ORF type:complete len:126 (+),score=8.91 TRINITY_DN663_c0_g1_i1:101-478(+)